MCIHVYDGNRLFIDIYKAIMEISKYSYEFGGFGEGWIPKLIYWWTFPQGIVLVENNLSSRNIRLYKHLHKCTHITWIKSPWFLSKLHFHIRFHSHTTLKVIMKSTILKFNIKTQHRQNDALIIYSLMKYFSDVKLTDLA